MRHRQLPSPQRRSRRPQVYTRIGVKPFLNLTATFTINGGTLMLPEVREAMDAASRWSVNLDELMEKAGPKLAEWMGARRIVEVDTPQDFQRALGERTAIIAVLGTGELAARFAWSSWSRPRDEDGQRRSDRDAHRHGHLFSQARHRRGIQVVGILVRSHQLGDQPRTCYLHTTRTAVGATSAIYPTWAPLDGLRDYEWAQPRCFNLDARTRPNRGSLAL